MCNRECAVKVDDYNNRICCNWGTEIAWKGWNGRLSTTGWSSIIIRRFEKYKLFSITVPIPFDHNYLRSF
jgi:hypothetical protein